MKYFLHVGCGNNKKSDTTRGFNTDEWIEKRFDIDESVKPDLIGSVIGMSMIESGTFDAVYSAHNIEHLYPHEVPLALLEFKRVLKPDGFLIITCPDLQSVCALVAEDKLDDTAYVSPAGPIAPMDILYGHRAALAKGNLFMAHKCGFTRSVLSQALFSAGFTNIGIKRRGYPFFDLWAVAVRSECSESYIRNIINDHLPAG